MTIKNSLVYLIFRQKQAKRLTLIVKKTGNFPKDVLTPINLPNIRMFSLSGGGLSLTVAVEKGGMPCIAYT